MATNRRRKVSARRVELSQRVVEHCVSGHDFPFLDSGGFDGGERELSDIAETYHKNAEYIEAENRKERGLFTRSAAWWDLVAVPRYGLRRQIVESHAKPLPDKGHWYGMPRGWTDRVKVHDLFESERDYLTRHNLLTDEEREALEQSGR